MIIETPPLEKSHVSFYAIENNQTVIKPRVVFPTNNCFFRLISISNVSHIGANFLVKLLATDIKASQPSQVTKAATIACENYSKDVIDSQQQGKTTLQTQSYVSRVREHTISAIKVHCDWLVVCTGSVNVIQRSMRC